MPEYDIALELARLHILKGADFVRQLKMLTGLSMFRQVNGESDIYSTGGEQSEDYESLLNAARKAVGQVSPKRPYALQSTEFSRMGKSRRKSLIYANILRNILIYQNICLFLQRERWNQVEPRCAERWHLRDDEQFDLAAWFHSHYN